MKMRVEGNLLYVTVTIVSFSFQERSQESSGAIQYQ